MENRRNINAPGIRRGAAATVYKVAPRQSLIYSSSGASYKLAPRTRPPRELPKRSRLRVFRPTFRKLGVIAMMAGMGFLLYIPSTWAQGWWERRDLRADFEQESASAMVMNQSILRNIQGAAELEKLKRLGAAAKAELSGENNTVAELEIPKIGLNSIIVEGIEESSLKKGPGHVPESPLPGMQGNFIVAGDRVLYGGLFLNLDELAPGDEIDVKTSYGRFTYKVVAKFITDADDTSILSGTSTETITLITCDPPWDISHRLVIRGEATKAAVI